MQYVGTNNALSLELGMVSCGTEWGHLTWEQSIWGRGTSFHQQAIWRLSAVKMRWIRNKVQQYKTGRNATTIGHIYQEKSALSSQKGRWAWTTTEHDVVNFERAHAYLEHAVARSEVVQTWRLTGVRCAKRCQKQGLTLHSCKQTKWTGTLLSSR